MIGKKLVLIGAGGIGSHTALLLARLEFEDLIIFDHDAVEPHNLENQVYSLWDIGRPKVEALRWHIHGLPQRGNVQYLQEKVVDGTPLKGIVIVAVDNLESRQIICRQLEPANPHGNFAPLLIEAGAAQNIGIIYILNPNDSDQIAKYEQTLYGLPAGDIALNQCVDPELGPVFAGIIAKFVKNFWAGWRPLFLTRVEIDFGDLTRVGVRDIK
ncbi:MAG: ThiF family adenylyltransferase [Candidatus Nealsonbacteria bacterium]|nr:ThiF family adenylyltransferase [Candidatus Nealsonbacteria bacterium]